MNKILTEEIIRRAGALALRRLFETSLQEPIPFRPARLLEWTQQKKPKP